MNEGYNPFPGLVYAPDICTLQGLSTDGLETGCLASTPEPGFEISPYHWFYRYDADAGGWDVDGEYVFSTYNGPEGLFFGDPCPLPPKQINSHRDSGPGRFIRLNIWDIFGY